MIRAVAAYIPVLHEGYHRFLTEHGAGRPLYLIGPELYADYRPLAKDIRALDPELVAAAVAAWGICSDVSVLDIASATRLAAQQPSLTLPAEDVSRQVVDRFFPRCEVWFDSVFLRWDKTRTVQLIPPVPDREATQEELERDLVKAARHEGAGSIDWWRQVGAAMRLSSGEVLVAANQHASHPLNAYAVGDPRSNFFKGVHFDLSTATHAEVALIGQAARRGLPTVDAVVAVTDFPCPACAKLLAAAGISKLYYQRGYAVLDGEQVLRDAGVELVHVPELVEATAPS